MRVAFFWLEEMSLEIATGAVSIPFLTGHTRGAKSPALQGQQNASAERSPEHGNSACDDPSGSTPLQGQTIFRITWVNMQ
ncbi:hypothetical protein A5724_17685 [Mycobacterium sp. ACS1612]|nr:hypothetical protein A5724_17685 [Mycobacterium sp. ACS1612]